MNETTSQVATLSLEEQVERVRAGYSDLPSVPLDDSVTPETFYLATPHRQAYALAWIVANQIVQARFPRSVIDALPIFHPENGWDRFLITRRASGQVFNFQPANEFGMILIDADRETPRYTSPGGSTRVDLSGLLEVDPQATIDQVLKHIPRPKIGTTEQNRLRKFEQAPFYPTIYQAVTELTVEHPGLVAAREIYIDDEEIDGQYHPLYLHAVELQQMGPDDRTGVNMATMTYNWFQLQIGERFAFADRRGHRAVFRTDRQTWSRVRKQLNEGPPEQVKERIMGWLRLDGREPNPELDG